MLILVSLYATLPVTYTSDHILKTGVLTEEPAQILYTTKISPRPMLPLAAQRTSHARLPRKTTLNGRESNVKVMMKVV
jgi:hypothetical protein